MIKKIFCLPFGLTQSVSSLKWKYFWPKAKLSTDYDELSEFADHMSPTHSGVNALRGSKKVNVPNPDWSAPNGFI